MIDIQYAKKVFKEYTKRYDLNDMKISVKVGHILRVSKISKDIAESLNLNEEDIALAELIGLLHDIGRFEQVKRYNTFLDKQSINHGEFGVKILFEENFIDEFKIDSKYYEIIKKAILNHNKAKIEDGLNERELLHAKIIRDSDKLDIYEVLLNNKLDDLYGKNFLEEAIFSEEIIREYKYEHIIDYGKFESHADLWIAHIAYVFDFYFKSSYIKMKENNYINKFGERLNFKNVKTKQVAMEIIKIANEYIDKSCK